MTAIRTTGFVLCLAACAAIARAQPEEKRLSSLRDDFQSPPPETRPLVRWWWFIPPPSREEATRELERIKEAGFGGVEIAFEQPILPTIKGDKALLNAIRVASLKAKQLGLSFELGVENAVPDLQSSAGNAQLAWVRRVASAIEPGAAHALSLSPRVEVSQDKEFYSFFKHRRAYDLRSREIHELEGSLEAWKMDSHLAKERAKVRHDIALTSLEWLEERVYSPFRKLAWGLHLGARIAFPESGLNPISPARPMDEPEGAAEAWNTLSPLRLAASKAHLQALPVVMGAAWNQLDRGAHGATPLDLKLSADVHFLAGATRILGTGWAGTSLPTTTWCRGTSALLNHDTPWLPLLPELSRYLQRISFVLQQGTPSRGILVYLPTEDALAEVREDNTDLLSALSNSMGEHLLPALLSLGYSVDFVDDASLALLLEKEAQAPISKKNPYPVLLLPSVRRLSQAGYAHLEAYLGQGGKLFFKGRIPNWPPEQDGSKQGSDPQHNDVIALCARHKNQCFQSPPLGLDWYKPLAKVLTPTIKTTPLATTLGMVHRHLPDADLYFIANTGNRPFDGKVTVRGKRRIAEWWNPLSGDITPAAVSPGSGAETSFDLDLPAYASRILFLYQGTPPRIAKGDQAKGKPRKSPLIRDITNGWDVTFVGTDLRKRFDWPVSWTEFADTRSFSGEAVYRKQVTIPAKLLEGGTVILSLGEDAPSPLPKGQSEGAGRSWVESPVREAAIVLVNGKRVGSIWTPPYELDLGPALVAGQNDLEIRVYNVVANQLAGRPIGKPATYDAGQPPRRRTIKAVPAGLLGPIVLRGR